MLPTTSPKKLSIFTSGVPPNRQPETPIAAEGPVGGKSRVHAVRELLIRVLGIILATAFIIWGPAGDFIAGRAFTITTTNEVTYIFYNWTVTLPLSTPSLNMQAWNNRLVGSVRFTSAPKTDTHYTINIETTAPGGMFKLTPWTMDQTQQSGFGIVVSDLLPNTYGIDYANVVVSIPSDRHYSELIWNTYPPATATSSLPTRKWNVKFDNLTQAGIYFDKVRILTDKGTIGSTGVRAAEGYFQTVGGTISGEYTVPPDHLTFNQTGGENPADFQRTNP